MSQDDVFALDAKQISEAEDDARVEVERANQARFLLDHELIQAFFDDHITALVEVASRDLDEERRNAAHNMLLCFDKFRTWFEDSIQTGKLASARLAELETTKRRFFRRSA